MGKKDPRVDAYIAKSADFARPILTRLRKLVHAGCPNVEETMKWSFPHFDYNGMMCSMAAFKQHCAFGFWKGKLILGKEGTSEEAMGQFGRITGLSDLPNDKTIIGYVKKAVRLNDEGIKLPSRPKARTKREFTIPDCFSAALRKNKKALATFESFSPSHQREYVEWITEAKTEDTRKLRRETTLEWLSEGKRRNWKYVRK